jgi:hypothetical protein
VYDPRNIRNHPIKSYITCFYSSLEGTRAPFVPSNLTRPGILSLGYRGLSPLFILTRIEPPTWAIAISYTKQFRCLALCGNRQDRSARHPMIVFVCIHPPIISRLCYILHPLPPPYMLLVCWLSISALSAYSSPPSNSSTHRFYLSLADLRIWQSPEVSLTRTRARTVSL